MRIYTPLLEHPIARALVFMAEKGVLLPEHFPTLLVMAMASARFREQVKRSMVRAARRLGMFSRNLRQLRQQQGLSDGEGRKGPAMGPKVSLEKPPEKSSLPMSYA